MTTEHSHMNTDTFIPKSEIEKKLLDAQVFLPIHDDSVAGIQTSDKARPIHIEAEDGTPILAVFTNPDRAKDFLATCPGKSGGLLESFRWVVEHAGNGVAISLNPGLDVGFDIEPEIVAQLSQDSLKN